MRDGCRYAVLGHEPGAMLLLAVAQQALLQLDNFSPQELTNMVSSTPTTALLKSQHKECTHVTVHKSIAVLMYLQHYYA